MITIVDAAREKDHRARIQAHAIDVDGAMAVPPVERLRHVPMPESASVAPSANTPPLA